MNMRIHLTLACMALGLFAAETSMAANVTWDANGATALQTDGAGTWTTASQWWDGANNVTWNSGTPDIAIIGNGGAGGTIALGSSITAGSLTFNRFSGTYTLGTSGDLTLNGSLTINPSAGGVSISRQITLGAAQTWTNNGGNAFTVSGNIMNGAYLLTVAGIANYSGTTISGIIGNGAGGLTKNGAGTLVLSGANTYIGATTVNAGQVTVNGANGVINTSSGITLSGGKLFLDSSANNNANRIANNVTLSLGGELSLSGNAAGTSESFGTLGVANGYSTVTVKGATLASTLAGSAFSRTANGTALIRGTSLGQGSASLGRITLGDASGLSFVGATTLNNAANTDTTKDVRIVPYLVGGTTDTDAGSTFITYDTTLGFRALDIANQFDTALTAGNNVRLTGNTTASSSVAVNSLIIANTSATALTINDGNTLTVSSGAILFTNTATIKPSATTGILTFGSDEGVVTVNSGLIGTISAVLNGSGGLTKAGTGTLVLSGSNGYTGNTTVNAGTLLATKAAALNSSTVVFNGGTLGVQVGGSGWTTGQVDTLLSGATKTAGALAIDTANGSLSQWAAFTPSNLGVLGLTKLGANTLTLDQANTYTGPTTVSAGTLTLSHANAIASSSGLVLSSSASVVLTTGVTLNALTYADATASSVTGGTLNFNPGGTINLSAGGSYTRTINVGITGAPTVITDNAQVTWQPTGSATMTLGNILVTHIASSNGGLTLDGATTGNSVGDITYASGPNSAHGLGITKNGIGTWTVGNVNKFNTGTPSIATINAGTLIVPSTGSLYGGAGVYGGQLQLNWSGAIGSGGLTLGATKTTPAQLDNAGGAAVTLSSNPAMTWNGNWTFLGSNGANSDLNLGTGAVTLANSALTGNPQVTVQNAATTLTVGGIIGGTGVGLIKAGPGTLKLSGVNTYSGPTAVSAGTLKLSNNSALAGSALDTTGAGFITLDTGITTPTFGGLKAGGTSRDLATVISSGYNLVTTLTLNPQAGVTVTYGGVIADGAANMNLTKTGAGTQILSGNNTYGGTTIVSNGTLVASTPGALPGYNSSGKVVLSGTGTLQVPVDGVAWTISQFETLLSNATKTSGSLGLDIATGTQTQSGVYGSSLGLAKVGAGTLELNQANSYTNTTTISAGTLLLDGASGAIASSAGITVGQTNGVAGILTLDNSSANNSDRVGSVGITLNNATFNYIGNASTPSTETIGTITAVAGHNQIVLSNLATLTSTAGAVTRTAGATLNILADGVNQQFAFTGGSAGINKGVFYGTTAATANEFAYYPSGGAAVVAPTYDGSGNFATPAATLTASKHNKLSTTDASEGDISIYSLNMPGNYSLTALTGNLTFSNAGDQGAIIKSGGGAAQIGGATDAFDIIGQTGGELVINTVDTADNLTLNVGIASSTTALTKTGAGTLTLTANRDYLFTGATYVNAGTLVLNSLTSAVAGGFRSSVTINNGGTAKLGASNKIIDTAAFTVNAGGTFDLAGFSEAITTLNGSGSVTNSTGTPSTLSWRGTGTSIFSGVISGNTSLFLDNANAYTINLTLSGQNTYTGTTTIGGGGAGGGILTLGANNAVPSGSTIYVGVIGGTSGGAVFDLAGFDQTAGPIYMAAGNTSASYARIVNTAGSSKLTLTGGASALTWTPRGTAMDASAIVGVTTVDLNNAPQTFTVGQVSFNTTVGYCLWVSSVITNGSLIKAGTGFLLLTGVNTYTGATTISGGTLEIGVSGVLGGGAYAANITNNATFSYNSTATQTLSGVISGTGALVKNNTGTLNLTGLNTYTNTTTVSAGTLLVNGSLNVTSRVTVASAGTLGGAGTMGIVTNTGTLAVGNGATMGTLTTSNLVMGASSTYVFDLNGTGSGDSVTVNGNLTLNSSSVITVVPQGVFNGGHTYTLFNYKTVSGTLPTTVLGGNPIRAMTLMDDSANNRIVLKVAGPAGTLISFF